VSTLVRVLDSTTEVLGRTVAWLTVTMVIATVIVVLLRYGLDTGAIALQESVTYMHACVFMLGIPYALKHSGHVRVDIFYARLSDRHRTMIDLAGHLVFLVPVAVLVLVTSLDYVAAAWRVREGSPEVGGIPAVYALKTLIPVMASTLLLQGIAEIARAALSLRSAEHP
jgi:TRAP-type mannitol/chloroaromatic compound transport system permease small subunit